jgi:uncharacterized membrane protein/glycosyltransferase involved in cell wall biosynthesis
MNGAKPRIAIVTDAVAPYHRGGKERRYQELAPRLNQHADVEVYTMRWWGKKRTAVHDGVTYHGICRFMPLYRGERRSIVQALVFAVACLRLMSARFDVVEADHMPYLQLFSLKLVALVRRKRLVVTWHEVWDRPRWTRYLGRAGIFGWSLEQIAMRLPDCIMADTPQTAEQLCSRVRGTVPIVTIPVGIDLRLISNTRSADEPVEIISVGRLLSHKRFDLLESIAQLARNREPRKCCIVGDGPERQALLAQASRLGIADLVDLRTDVSSHEQLLSIVKASRVFVFPSEREGFGIAALEAIACHVPVITTSAPDNLARHLVGRAEGGLICEPTAEALAPAIESVLSSRADHDPTPDQDWLGEYDWGVIAMRVADVLTPGHAQPAAAQVREAPRADPTAPGADETPPPAAAPRLTPGRLESGDWAPIAGGAEPEDMDGREASEPAGAETATEELPEPGVELSPDLIASFERPGRQRTRETIIDLLVSVVAVGAMASLAYVRGAWAVQAAELFLLLSVPGILLLRAARVTPGAVLSFPLYIVFGSLTVLMLSGVAVDLLGPPLGVSRPLATSPLVVSLSIACAVLIALCAVREPPRLRAYLPARVQLWHAWPLVLPLLAWIGATRLNNGHGTTLAIVAVAVTSASLILGAVLAQKWNVGQSAILLYAASLALMWSFTLRGHFVYGYDISGEYQTFLNVLHAGRWHAFHHADPYGAMVSLTILPSSLAALTGAAPLLIFKAVYPFLFALLPIAVFLIAARIVDRRFAYLGALFIVVQDFFFQQLPAIARQEIALLFFVFLVGAMFDRRLRRGSQIAVLAVAGIGLVLSHYGTTYVTIAFLALALLAELLRRLVMVLLRRRSSIRRATLAPFAVSLAIVAGGAAVWYVPVTDSAQNLGHFFSQLSHQGLSLLPNSGGKNVLQSYLSGNVPKTVSGPKFAADARQDFSHRPYIVPLPQAYSTQYQLVKTTVPSDRILSHPASRALDADKVLITQVAGLLAVIGAFLLWWRRGTGDTARSIGLLAVSTLLVLLGIRFSGTAALEYNQGRAFLQSMVPLSICLAWILQAIASRRRGAFVPIVYVVAVGLALITTSGLRGTIVGGSTPTNLASTGEDFERFYFSQTDFAAARWLAAHAPPRDVIFTDRYGYLRFVGETGRSKNVFSVLTPTTLDPNAWIYAYSANFTGHRARGQEGNDFALYEWPSFVDHFWNIAYTNGSSAVYGRPH